MQYSGFKNMCRIVQLSQISDFRKMLSLHEEAAYIINSFYHPSSWKYTLCLYGFAYSELLYQWNHLVYSIFCLPSLT